jgi:hypothetical protein
VSVVAKLCERTSFICELDCGAVLSPETLLLFAACQVNDDPGGVPCKGIFNVSPLQMTALLDDIMEGKGLTVTVIVNGVPWHPLADGVTV